MNLTAQLPNARKLVGLLELVGVAAMVRAHASFCSEHRLSEQLLNFGGATAYVLNPGEARFYLATALVGIPMALLLVDASLRLLDSGSRSLLARAAAHPRWTALALALLAMVLAELVAISFGHAQFTDDERIYLWQARNLLAGSFTAVRPEPAEFFHGGFWFMLPVANGRWGATYPPGAAGLLALGMLVHATHLPQLLCVGLIVWVAARFAEEVWGAEASVISAALLATSPALVLTGATFHNAIPTTLGTLVGLRAAFAANRLGRIRDCALAGAGFGGALLCRLLDAVAIGVPAALLMLVGVLRAPTDDPTRRRRLVGLGVGVLCALPFVALLLASQRAVTGDMFLAPYSLMVRVWPNAHVFGFGNSAFGVTHTVQLALSKALVTWARLDAWSFGWPLALFVPILVVFGLGRDRVATWLLAAIGLKMAAYFFYVAPAVQTFGSYYNLPEVPLLAALTARAVLASRDRFHATDASLARLPLRMLAALTITAVALFWPCQLAWLTRTGATINAPLDVAAEEARKGPVVVFYAQMQPPGLRETSWVFWPPLASGNMDEPVLWAANWGLHNLELLKRMPHRRPFLLTWDDGVPGLEPWTPALAPPGSERGPNRVEPTPVVVPPPSAMVLPEAYRWPVVPNKR